MEPPQFYHRVYLMNDIETDFYELMYALIVLLEYKSTVLGHTREKEQIVDFILEVSHETKEV
jgi:hypothetical protein